MVRQSQTELHELSSMLVGDGDRLLAVVTLDAFLDESGTNAGAPFVTVAGFYGSKDQWATFREHWKPHSVGFHAKDSEDRFPDLCSAIETSELNGIFITLGKAAYREVATEQMKSRLGNPYALCAFQNVLSICREVNLPTAFVLERGQPNLSFVTGLLEYMMDSGEFCIASVTTAKKEDYIELHPADFVSHCSSTLDKPWLERLLAAKRLKHGHLEGEKLRSVGPELSKLIHKARKQRLIAKNLR